MTAALVLDNLAAWSAQVAILVAVASAAALTISHPRGRLIFWQGVLAIALLLPVVEPWQTPPVEDIGPAAAAATHVPVTLVHRSPFQFEWRREYLLILVAAGAALRFLWIGAGLIRLRRHRLDATMLATPPVPFSSPHVRWFVSNTVGGPVTFGFLNPSILLPARVVEMEDDLKEAIAHHELAHVRRRDWLFVLGEESIRSLLWFHPAIWLVLSRIQLAREQVVDAEVVGLTRDRQRYLDALVAVAAQRILPDVAPAPLFLKKRQLAMRVAAVLKETRMSKPRMLLSFTTVCSAAVVAACLAVWMFPLQAPAQSISVEKGSIVADGPGVVVDPGAKILHRSPVFYPSGVTTTGTVVVESTVNSKGEVTDAHVVSGPEELRSAVLASVLNWHFSTDGGLGPTVQSTIRFDAAPTAATPANTVHVTTNVHAASLSLKAIDTSALPDDLAEKVRASLPVHIGDAVGSDEFARVQAAAKEVDEHLAVGLRTAPGEATLIFTLRPAAPPASADALPAIPPAADGAKRLRIGGNVQAMNLIRKVVPQYPPTAKLARVQGQVKFTALIGTDGNIVALQLISGDPLLYPAAQQAVSQWQYRPTLLNGNPVEVLTQIDVNFTLSQ